MKPVHSSPVLLPSGRTQNCEGSRSHCSEQVSRGKAPRRASPSGTSPRHSTYHVPLIKLKAGYQCPIELVKTCHQPTLQKASNKPPKKIALATPTSPTLPIRARGEKCTPVPCPINPVIPHLRSNFQARDIPVPFSPTLAQPIRNI